jgi:hypothetical protein
MGTSADGSWSGDAAISRIDTRQSRLAERHL